jgi:hypothetical protein
MDPKSDKPLRLFVNPLALWTEFALKTGQAMWASAAQAARSNTAPKVAVIPTLDAPVPKARQAATPSKRQASKAARSKAPRAKPRRKAALKRRAARR